jgi:aminoglycoside phosphotransferase (APT) family kinase protein
MPPVEVNEANVWALLERWFPHADFAIERMGSGGSTPVYRITQGEDIAWLRLAEQPGERRDAEVRAHEFALERGIWVPAILRFEAEPPELARSAALTSTIPGIPLSEYRGHADTVIGDAAADLASLNAIPVIGYGWVGSVQETDRRLVAEHPVRASWATEYATAAATVAGAGILPGPDALHLADAIGQWCALPGGAMSNLAHGDFDATHIYVDPGTGAYQGMIDLGEIRGADPVYDLGHALAHGFDQRERSMAHALIAAYAHHAKVDDGLVRLNAIAIATRALAIQLERPPNSYRANLITRLADLLADGHRAT